MVKNETYMRVAAEFAKSSYCKRAQVGALIVKDGNVIGVDSSDIWFLIAFSSPWCVSVFSFFTGISMSVSPKK